MQIPLTPPLQSMSSPAIQAAAADLRKVVEGLAAEGRRDAAALVADLMKECARELLRRVVTSGGGDQAAVDMAAVRLGVDGTSAH